MTGQGSRSETDFSSRPLQQDHFRCRGVAEHRESPREFSFGTTEDIKARGWWPWACHGPSRVEVREHRVVADRAKQSRKSHRGGSKEAQRDCKNKTPNKDRIHKKKTEKEDLPPAVLLVPNPDPVPKPLLWLLDWPNPPPPKPKDIVSVEAQELVVHTALRIWMQ
jgi:hypothetical protein